MLLGVIFRRVYVYIWKFNLTVLELDFWADSHTNVYILHMGKNSISSNLKKKIMSTIFSGLKRGQSFRFMHIYVVNYKIILIL